MTSADRKTILLAGSRDLNEQMTDYIRAVLHRVFLRSHFLIFGDAHGADEYAVRRAQFDALDCMTFGITAKPRNRALAYTNVRDRLAAARDTPARELYRLRDEFMVRQADLIICVWNGESPGTKHVFDYAQAIGKQAHLKVCAPAKMSGRRLSQKY